MASDLLFKETIQVYGSIWGMGTFYVAMYSEEQVAAEIWICTKTPGISANNIRVMLQASLTDQWLGQISSPFHIFVQYGS